MKPPASILHEYRGFGVQIKNIIMKRFIIINGGRLYTTKQENLEQAQLTAFNNCDHSLPIFVAEIPEEAGGDINLIGVTVLMAALTQRDELISNLQAELKKIKKPSYKVGDVVWISSSSPCHTFNHGDVVIITAIISEGTPEEFYTAEHIRDPFCADITREDVGGFFTVKK